MLRHFVDAARGRLNLLPIKMIQRDAAFADGVSLFDGFCDIRLRESRCFEKRAANREMRRYGRRKGATSAV